MIENLPIELQLWNASQCAEYLGQAYNTFIGRTQYSGNFPPRCKPTGSPRWRARDVIRWAMGDVDENLQKIRLSA